LIILSPNTAATLSPLTTDQSWVMFVQVHPPVGSGPIKIEAVDGPQIAARLKSLSVENAYETFVIGLIPTDDPVGLEQDLHEQFAAANLRHDWFTPTYELLAYVQETAQQALEDLLAQTRPGGLPDHAVDITAMAGLLGVSVPTVRRLVKAGEIPHLRMGKALRFVPADVIASLEQRG